MAGRTRFARYLIADLRDLLERPGALFGLFLGLVGAAFLVVGLLGAVLVGPDNTWTITRTLRPGTPAVVVTPGVVGAIGPQLTVSALYSGPMKNGSAVSFPPGGIVDRAWASTAGKSSGRRTSQTFWLPAPVTSLTMQG